MQVKLIINSQFIGKEVKTVVLQSNVSDDDIKALFPIYFGIKYSPLMCSFEREDKKNDI
jgi:hypothetical protein